VDIWFALFVTIIALVAATGFSLFLVGYLSVMPVSFGQGRRWLAAVCIVPATIVVLPVAAYAVFTLFSPAEMTPLQLGKRLLGPAFGLHLLVVLVFVAKHWRAYAKAAKQLLVGLVLLALAVGALYGIGPTVAERAVAIAKEPR